MQCSNFAKAKYFLTETIFNMSFKSLFAAALLLVCTTLLSAQGIIFEKGSWADVQKKAKEENKYIFVDAYAEWCGPCKWMAKNVFTDAKVAAHFNSNFVNYKFDMEKGEGPEFAKKFVVSAYPTLLFFNPAGELVHKVLGAQQVDQLIAQSEKAVNPEEQLFTMKRKYNDGERNPEFLLKYVKMLLDANEEVGDAVDNYLSSIKKEEWTSEENFNIIAMTTSDYKSEKFKYIVSNRAAFEKSIGAEIIDQYFQMVYSYAINEVSESHDANAYNKLKADIEKDLGEKGPALIAYLNFSYNIGDKDEFKFAKIYFDKYCDNANMLNQIAWQYFETETDKKKLKAALNWVNRSVSLNKNFYNLDTKANLLNKLGKKKEALAAAEEAVKLAKADGEDATETEALIRNLKK
jgi:thioredoxin-related protein